MWQRRTRSSRRSAHGVGPIKRESYSTVSGMNTKAGWWEVRKKVEQRSGGRCESRRDGERCLNKGVEVHHIVPLNKGGTNSMANLIHLCINCHNRRHNHLIGRGKA